MHMNAASSYALDDDVEVDDWWREVQDMGREQASLRDPQKCWIAPFTKKPDLARVKFTRR